MSVSKNIESCLRGEEKKKAFVLDTKKASANTIRWGFSLITNIKSSYKKMLLHINCNAGQEIAKQLYASSSPVILVGRNAKKLTKLHRGLAQDYPNLEI